MPSPDRKPGRSNGRSGMGKFTSTPDTARRDNQAAHLRHDQGMTFQQIADAMGYASPSSAHEAVNRALRAYRTEGVAELKTAEYEHLLRLRAQAWALMADDSPLVSEGRVVKGPDGEPLPDLDRKLRAVVTLARLSERVSRLMGLDAPRQHKVETSSALDAEIEELVARMTRQQPQQPQQQPAAPSEG